MSEAIDYKKLGFKCGLEVHQQLDTKRKLFCNCPPILRRDTPDVLITRKLHPVPGEGGSVDTAAEFESLKNKTFVYEGYSDSTCLVECDESPPSLIDQEALQIALHISLLLNCKIMPLTQIMRKTVIDGSNTSGFQRTVLIAKNGWLDTKYGRVGIESIFLEEDAARIVERGDRKEIYKLDRLGIPLVEIVTAPDIKNPEQAKDIALQIGEVLRSCRVRRGIGTIRQDVNVSIRGENRIELKGMQDMSIFTNVIENEVLRQKKLSDAGKPTKMEVRTAQKDGTTEFMRPLPGSARMYPETDLPLLKISRSFINTSKKTKPRHRAEVKEELRKQGLREDMIKALFKSNKLDLYKKLHSIVEHPGLVAKMLFIYPKDIAKRMGKTLKFVEKKLEKEYEDILYLHKKKNIKEHQIKHALEKRLKGEKVEFKKVDLSSVEEKIRNIIKSKPGLSEKAYMGLVMKEFKGSIAGRDAMRIIQKFLK